MNRTFILATLIAISMTLLPARADTVLWYNGDYTATSGGDGLISENGGGGFFDITSFVYDNFAISSSSGVTSVFGYFFADTSSILGADFEIRTGMSDGDGGTLAFSGNALAAIWTPTATTIYNNDLAETLTLYRLDLSVTGVTLTPGTYWLGLRPDLDDSQDQNAFAASTAGANSIGYLPGNAFVDNEGYPLFASFMLTTGGGYPDDYSYGINGSQAVSSTPEPAAWSQVLIGAFLCFLSCKSRRST